MKILKIGLVILPFTCLLLMKCSKTQQIIVQPRLFITLKDDTGRSVPGATVRLYKNAQDPGITQISDSTGFVIFDSLEAKLYYWLAEKGCKTNRNSQTTLNRPLVPNAILYGYSVLSETGTLEITNASTEPYNVSNSLFKVTVSKDTPYIAYPKAESYLTHIEKVSTPGIVKDTLIKIRCGDTTFLRLPY